MVGVDMNNVPVFNLVCFQFQEKTLPAVRTEDFLQVYVDKGILFLEGSDQGGDDLARPIRSKREVFLLVLP